MEKIILILCFICIGYLFFEKKRAMNQRKTFKYVIHVNGIRGKSTVSRLIDAGVRTGGYKTFTKTTGTSPRTISILGEEKEIVILEDGINDYSNRPRWISKEKMKSVYNWQGFFLAKMGYCSPGWFWFEPDRYCIKYSSQPEKMKYRNYKEIRQLYTQEGTDEKLFDHIVKKIYPAIQKIDFEKTEAVLFTRSLDDFVVDDKKYIERIENYIQRSYKNILLKKHPREQSVYQFENGIKCLEVDNSVPAEVLLPYLKGKDIILITTSAIMLYMKAYQLTCNLILLDGMYEENMKSGTKYRLLCDEEVIEYCENFAEGHYMITTI